MKLRFISLILLSLSYVGVLETFAKNTQAYDEYDVFLLIGQSNMAGRGYMIDGDDAVIDKNVFILDNTGNIVPACNPLNQYSSIRKELSKQQVGPGLGFAKRISQKTGRKILLVVNARGGTTIDQWTKGDSGMGYYEEAVRRTKLAMEFGQLKAIIWHQGCGDAKKSDVYMGKLSSFVQSLRDDLGVSVPFVAGELGQWRSHVRGFNTMLHTISDYIPDSDWVSSKGCLPIVTKRSGGKPDMKDPHFDRKSQLLIGRRYADKVLKMCYGKKTTAR